LGRLHRASPVEREPEERRGVFAIERRERFRQLLLGDRLQCPACDDLGPIILERERSLGELAASIVVGEQA
jgi:hypothetical protein